MFAYRLERAPALMADCLEDVVAASPEGPDRLNIADHRLAVVA